MVHDTRERRRRETTRQILAEARQLVLSEGVDGLTVARLARAVGYTPGALYRYFPSKGALLATVHREILEGWTAVLDQLDDPDPLVPVLGAGAALARFSVERREDFALVAATLADPRDLVPDPADAVHIPATRALLASLSAHLRRAADAGVLLPGDPDRRAVAYVFSQIGLLQLAKLSRFDPVAFDAPALAGATARDLLSAWGADPARLAAASSVAAARVEVAVAALQEEP